MSTASNNSNLPEATKFYFDTYNVLLGSVVFKCSRTCISDRAASQYLSTFLTIFTATCLPPLLKRVSPHLKKKKKKKKKVKTISNSICLSFFKLYYFFDLLYILFFFLNLWFSIQFCLITSKNTLLTSNSM